MGTPGDLLPAGCIYTDSHAPAVPTQPAACTQPVHMSTQPHSHPRSWSHRPSTHLRSQVHTTRRPGERRLREGPLCPIPGGLPHPGSQTRTHRALPEAARRPAPAAQTELVLREPGGAGASPTELGRHLGRGGTWAGGNTGWGRDLGWRRDLCGVAPGLGAGTGLRGGTWTWGATG